MRPSRIHPREIAAVKSGGGPQSILGGPVAGAILPTIAVETVAPPSILPIG